MGKRPEAEAYNSGMFPGLSDIPVEDTPKANREDDKTIEKQIDELVGCFSDPIIVWPGGWGESLPETIKSDITIHRMIQLMKGESLAGWPEVCAYMFTVTLERMVSSEWVDIYMYAMTQYKGEAMPEDMRRDSLNDYEMGLLNDLRRWIYRRRREASQEKLRAVRKQEREEQKEAEQREIQDSRPGLF